MQGHFIPIPPMSIPDHHENSEMAANFCVVKNDSLTLGTQKIERAPDKKQQTVEKNENSRSIQQISQTAPKFDDDFVDSYESLAKLKVELPPSINEFKNGMNSQQFIPIVAERKSYSNGEHFVDDLEFKISDEQNKYQESEDRRRMGSTTVKNVSQSEKLSSNVLGIQRNRTSFTEFQLNELEK